MELREFEVLENSDVIKYILLNNEGINNYINERAPFEKDFLSKYRGKGKLQLRLDKYEYLCSQEFESYDYITLDSFNKENIINLDLKLHILYGRIYNQDIDLIHKVVSKLHTLNYMDLKNNKEFIYQPRESKIKLKVVIDGGSLRIYTMYGNTLSKKLFTTMGRNKLIIPKVDNGSILRSLIEEELYENITHLGGGISKD